MRRSRSVPWRGSPPTRDTISRSESPPPRLKKKGAFMPPCPWRWSAARSECGPATEPEVLLPIVLLFQERYREVEPDRPERRGPQDAGADRRTHMHGVVERAIRVRRRTNRPLDFLACCREVERTFVVPDRARVGEHGELHTRILGQEVERRLQLHARAPVHRATERIAGRSIEVELGEVARANSRRSEAANKLRAHLEVVKHAQLGALVGESLAAEAVYDTALQGQQTDDIRQNLVVALYIGRCPQIGDVAADAGEVLPQDSEDTAGRIAIVVQRVVAQVVADHRGEHGALSKLAPHRQRGLAIREAVGVERE